MFEKFSNKIIIYSANKGYINQNQIEEYNYGFNIFLNAFIILSSMILIGMFMHMTYECIVFCILYKTLRQYVGGYHCDSPTYCYVSSCIMCIITLLMIKYVPYHNFIYLSFTVFSSIILFILSPIDAVNKPLDDMERKIFGAKARVIICILSIIYIVILHMKWLYISKIISISIGMVLFFAILGKAKLNKHKKNLKVQ